MKQRHPFSDSFNFAIEGIISGIRRERNMKMHLLISIIVLIISLFIGINRDGLIFLSLSITFVWVTELINTAIEIAIDIFCKSYNPLAKLAKDISAGAVLVACFNAVVVGYIIFVDYFEDSTVIFLNVFKSGFSHTVVILVTIVSILVIAIKAFFSRGKPLSGGMPSGHSAIASSLWVAITFLSDNVVIIIISLIMLILILQSRIEGKIHTLKEVVAGVFLGGLVTYIFLFLLDKV